MDLNLHLLHPDQLCLIQKICQIKGKIESHLFDGFEEVRDKIDLIILTDTTGYDMYREDLKYEEEEIRERIRKEKILWGDSDFPKLPNYDDPENKEPLWLTLDNLQHDDSRNTPGRHGNKNKESLWLSMGNLQGKNPVENFIAWTGKGRMPSLSSTIDYITEATDNSHNGCLTKYQLLQLDACLCRIKWDRLRLISKSITGCYAVSKNRKHKRVYLFPNAIENVARSYNADVNSALAVTFIHEMFHAYFDDTKAKGFIYQYLKRIVEIEEAVTECSTLLFIRQHYPNFQDFAEVNIKEKFDHGKPGLYCYGVGYYLYESNLIKNIFNKYRKIQRAPRLSVREVAEYLREVQSTSPSSQKCVNYIVLLVNYFNKIVGTDMKHYAFNGKKFGWEIHLVCAVLNYYVAKNKPTLAQIQADFRTAVNNDFFEVLSTVHSSGKEKEYNLDVQITLSCGSVIVPRKIWNNSIETDNTPRFINEVKRLYHSSAKTIDLEINVLR